MTDHIRRLTTQLATDPGSLVFLQLGEALRVRGQADAARRVALTGLQRYPDLADAHDLLARIYGDLRDFERAFDEWDIALRLDPAHAGAHKGIGFLYFVAGELPRAAHHLAQALAGLPGDDGVRGALERVQAELGRATAPPAPPAGATPVAAAPRAPRPADGMVIADGHGLRLGGLLTDPAGTDLADAAAAAMQGVSREAIRAARMLGLGEWSGLTASAAGGGLAIVPVAPDTVLLLVREAEIPLARLGGLARRAADEARTWLAAGA